MRITITDNKPRRFFRHGKKFVKKKDTWFASWKAKKIAEGTWKELNSGGKKNK